MSDAKFDTNKTGAFSVKVSYKQTGAGKLHADLANYTYVVKKFNQSWAARRGPIKGYYIDHDFRIGESWLYIPTSGQVQL